MKNLIKALLLVLCAAAVQAQSRYEASVEQYVSADTLYLNFYLQRVAGGDMVLGSANFAVVLPNAPVDFAAKALTTAGPWDSQVLSDSYRATTVGGAGFVNLSVFRRTDGGGAGQAVTTTRRRVGQVALPITDSCGASAVEWLTGPMSIRDFEGREMKAQFDFIAPDTLPLSAPPAAPLVTADASVICVGSTALLTATGETDQWQWFYEGAPVEGATGATLQAALPGSYHAVNYRCDYATRGASVIIDVVEPAATPTIVVNQDRLVSSPAENYQWFLDGDTLPGETGPDLIPPGEGDYSVATTNSCGTAFSNPFTFQVTSTEATTGFFAFNVYPNPYEGVTNVRYTLPQAGPVHIDVVNALGQPVAVLADGRQSAGEHRVTFSAVENGHAPGLYIIRLTYEGVTTTFKVIEQ
ncbi:MAG: T9SS type A sorting domain-containing protein [Catalinimonas sp.]